MPPKPSLRQIKPYIFSVLVFAKKIKNDYRKKNLFFPKNFSSLRKNHTVMDREQLPVSKARGIWNTLMLTIRRKRRIGIII